MLYSSYFANCSSDDPSPEICENSSPETLLKFDRNFLKLQALHREIEIEFTKDISVSISDIKRGIVDFPSTAGINELAAKSSSLAAPQTQKKYEMLLSSPDHDNRNLFAVKIDQYSEIYREKKEEIFKEMDGIYKRVNFCERFRDCKSCLINKQRLWTDTYRHSETCPSKFKPRRDLLPAVDGDNVPLGDYERNLFDKALKQKRADEKKKLTPIIPPPVWGSSYGEFLDNDSSVE